MAPNHQIDTKNIPGRSGNRFDTFLHTADKIEHLNSIYFIIILCVLAIVSTRFQWLYALEIFLFILIDWLLIGLLPFARKSFGPQKPTVLLLALFRSFFAFLPTPLALIFQGIGSLLVIYSFWIEPHHITITKQFLFSDKLTSSKPLIVLHLGDLHIERLTNREIQLQNIIDETKPDLVLFSGDAINLSYLQDPLAQKTARLVISKWHAPLGVYLVSGSPAVDLAQVFPHLVSGLPVRWLQNEKAIFLHNSDIFEVIGMSCSHNPLVDNLRLQEIIDLTEPSNHFRILLYHSPDLAPDAAGFDIDLQLSGHTHGGQVRIPFYGAIYTASLTGKRYESGRRSIDKMVLYVTRGIGMEGAAAPRVRFLCPPEVILWYISSSNQKEGENPVKNVR